MPEKSSPVIIVGAGAFGLSTALHLSQSGFTDIAVFDKDDQIPARYSAANDLNKIVRAEYDDPFYTDLTIKAIDVWKKNPLFTPHFHQTGFLHCVSGAAPEKAIGTLRTFQASAENHPQLKPHVTRLTESTSIQDRFWQYNGSFPGWNGYLNTFDGYAHAANALKSVCRATQKVGVRYFLGEENGAVGEIIYEVINGRTKAVGIRTEAGRFHTANLVIVAAGATVGRLVPQIRHQVVAKSWSIAHVRLTDEETSALRGIPVTYARDLGFFFEPDPKTNLLKLCPMGGGIVNTDQKTGLSFPPPSLKTSAFMPGKDEESIRELLAETLPALAQRPLVHKSLCWFADTRDSDFIIDYVPETSSSVIVLSGDSGHGFKMFPIVGSWVVDLLEDLNGIQSIQRWKWKSSSGDGQKGSWGGDVSWRLGETKEFRDVQPNVPKL